MDMDIKREDLIEIATRIRNAKNELVFAAIVLDKSNLFDKTASQIKETIGDLAVSERHIDDFIE